VSIQVTRNCCTGGCFSKNPSDKAEQVSKQQGIVAQADASARIQVTKFVAQADSSKTNESKNKKFTGGFGNN
jgi:hypothetical protein